MTILRIHHVAIICSDYERSKYFYTEILGFAILAENFRADKNSYKLDHLAFEVNDVVEWKTKLENMGIYVENIRIDEYTNRRFVFFADPDELPIELYEL
jgi:glyoxylase I family protein